MTHTERRATARIQLRKPAYINFEPYNNGGVITDISGAGLRFHTVAPVQQGGLVRLSILLGAAHQLEAVGELVWMDSARTVGGVRFTVLPVGAAEQIRNWAEAPEAGETAKSSTPLPASPASASASAPGNESPLPGNHDGQDARISQNTPQSKIEAGSIPNPQPAPAAVPTSGPSGASERPAWVPPSMRAAASGAPFPSPAPKLPDPGAAHPQSWSVPPVYQQPAEMPWVTHFDPDPPAHAPFVRGLFGGIVICAMLASAGWLAFRHYGMSLPWQTSATATQSDRPLSPAASAPSTDSPGPDLPNSDLRNSELPNSLTTGGSSLPSPEAPAVPSQAAQSPQSVQSPQEVPSSVGPDAQAPAEEKPSADSRKAAPSPSRPSQLAAPRAAPRETLSARGNSPAPPAQPARTPIARTPVVPPAQADAGETQLLLAREYLDGAGHARDTTVASRLLWTAVEKGNATAETTLADLYLRGDGVTKSCDQARVLLAAASGKGNVDAMQKLQQLNQTGCR